MCYEVRQVFKLPLRQCQGFIDSLFHCKGWNLKCPDHSCLLKRLSLLNIPSPRYTKTDVPDADVAAIAIDSSGLKRFGRGEWIRKNINYPLKEASVNFVVILLIVLVLTVNPLKP